MFLLCWVFVAVLKLSLVAASRGYSPDVVLRLLIVVASLVAEGGPWSAQVLECADFSSCHTWAQERQLQVSRAQAINSCGARA